MTDPTLVAKAVELVVDLGTGYVLERIAEPVLAPTWAVVKSVLFPRWDGAREALQLNLEEAVRRRQAEDRQFTERLDRSLQSGEAGALAAKFVREAAQATTSERMEMLARAAAGVFTPDLTSEMRSRVARAVAQLEPSDVVALRSYAGLAHAIRSTLSGSRLRHSGLRRAIFSSSDNAQAALIAAGCLLLVQKRAPFARDEDPLEMVAETTELGTAVLKALGEWNPPGAKRAEAQADPNSCGEGV